MSFIDYVRGKLATLQAEQKIQQEDGQRAVYENATQAAQRLLGLARTHFEAALASDPTYGAAKVEQLIGTAMLYETAGERDASNFQKSDDCLLSVIIKELSQTERLLVELLENNCFALLKNWKIRRQKQPSSYFEEYGGGQYRTYA